MSMERGASRNAGDRNEAERPGLGRYHFRLATRRDTDVVLGDGEQATGGLLDESYRVHPQPVNTGHRSDRAYDEPSQSRDEHLVFDVEMHEAAEYNEDFQEDEPTYSSPSPYYLLQQQQQHQPSGDNRGFTLSSDNNASVPSSARILRMTPARRRRQSSNPFYSPAVTTSSQNRNNSTNRPSHRLQRTFHDGVGNGDIVEHNTRQTELPRMLRRSRTSRHASTDSDGQRQRRRQGQRRGQRQEYGQGQSLGLGQGQGTAQGLGQEQRLGQQQGLGQGQGQFPGRIPTRSYWGSFQSSGTSQETHRMPQSVADNEPFASPRTSDHRSRGRYSEPDVWRLNGRHDSPRQQSMATASSSYWSNLAGMTSSSSSASVSSPSPSSSSSSSTATPNESSTPISGQGLRRRLTRVAARRFFGRGENGANVSDGNDTTSDPLDPLARILSIAASLVVAREDSTESSNQLGDESRDLGLEGILSTLLRAPRSAESPAVTVTVDEPTQTSRQSGSVHLFRLGGTHAASFQRSMTDPMDSVSVTPMETVREVAASSNTNRDGAGENGTTNSSQMVPVVIVGIQSVPQRDVPDQTILQTEADSAQQQINNTEIDGHSDTSFASRNSYDRPTASPGTHTTSGRSLIIYVFSGSYPSTHPFVSTPSLFTENPTYEDLMLLTSLLGPARPVTTTQGEIDASLPTALYDESVSGVQGFEILGNSEKCQVCLCDYVQDDTLRLLGCHHGFHRECIDKWLTEGSNKCPICRGEGVPSSTSNASGNQSGSTPVTATQDQGNLG